MRPTALNTEKFTANGRPMNYMNSPSHIMPREDSIGHKPSLQGLASMVDINVKRKKPMPLPEEFLNENIDDINDDELFNQIRPK